MTEESIVMWRRYGTWHSRSTAVVSGRCFGTYSGTFLMQSPVSHCPTAKQRVTFLATQLTTRLKLLGHPAADPLAAHAIPPPEVCLSTPSPFRPPSPLPPPSLNLLRVSHCTPPPSLASTSRTVPPAVATRSFQLVRAAKRRRPTVSGSRANSLASSRLASERRPVLRKMATAERPRESSTTAAAFNAAPALAELEPVPLVPSVALLDVPDPPPAPDPPGVPSFLLVDTDDDDDDGDNDDYIEDGEVVTVDDDDDDDGLVPELSPVAHRGERDVPAAAAAQAPSDSPSRKSKDLPLPPRFPTMKDVSTSWPESGEAAAAAATADAEVVWNRKPSDAATSASIAQASSSAAAAGSSVDLAPATSTASASSSDVRSPKPPVLVRVKRIVCKLPDPTLLFFIEASILLLLHSTRPFLLRTWPARILTPLLLVPTVAAAALWRPTTAVPVLGRSLVSIGKPIPSAAKVVVKGEVLRAREATLLSAEEELRDGQMKLEVLRKQIEGKLPPTVSIAALLESDSAHGAARGS